MYVNEYMYTDMFLGIFFFLFFRTFPFTEFKIFSQNTPVFVLTAFGISISRVKKKDPHDNGSFIKPYFK